MARLALSPRADMNHAPEQITTQRIITPTQANNVPALTGCCFPSSPARTSTVIPRLRSAISIVSTRAVRTQFSPRASINDPVGYRDEVLYRLHLWLSEFIFGERPHALECLEKSRPPI